MNEIKVTAFHKAFQHSDEKIDFVYKNVQVVLEKHNKKIIISFISRKSIEVIEKIFIRVYDLLFLLLGGFPKIELVTVNGMEEDVSKWARRYHTSEHFLEKEARFCEISSDTINEKSLTNMDDINRKTLHSLEYIVCEYYEHMVSEHRIELITHTIDGFLRHTKMMDLLLNELRSKNPKKKRIDYIDSVERVFRRFFFYHRKYNVQLLRCMHIKNIKMFLQIIADTRNDFSHFLENKEYRLIKGKDMVYFIDVIFIANRLFLIEEILNIPIINEQVKEYMYIMHDWVDDIVNDRNDRIKSKRYKLVENAKKMNDIIKDIYKE